jgi:hypothetical protein
MLRSDRRHPHMGAVAAVLAALLALPTGGCSWIGVTRAPQRPVPATPPVQCTSGVAAPVGDTIIGVLAIAAGAVLAVAGASPICLGAPCPADTGLVLAGVGIMALGVTAGVSAVFGYGWTAECRELEEVQTRCIAGVEASCAALRADPASSQVQEK